MSEENTIRNLADKIISDYNLTVKEKTDNLLKLNTIQHSNLGIDSLKAEKAKVKSDSKYIFKQIQTIDNKLGTGFIKSMDA
jgi:ribonuclease HI